MATDWLRVGRSGLLALALALPSAAFAAGPVDDGVAAARTAIASKDWKSAAKALDGAEAAAPTAAAVVSGRVLAKVWYLRGVVEYMQGDKKGRAMDLWRQALVLDNELPWDESVLKADDPQTLFEALRAEVRGRSKVDIGAPEATGTAKLFVDGKRRTAGDAVLDGTHLTQVECPDGKVYGEWTTFKKPAKWLKLCPGGVDTSAVVADEAPTDEWSEFGPMFGAPVTDGESILDVPFEDEGAPVEQPVADVSPSDAVAEEPVAEEPVAEEPVAEEPVAEEPVAEEPVAEEPVYEEPVAEEPVYEEPVAEEPVAEEPVAEEPVAEEPVAETPVADATPEEPAEDPVHSTPDVDLTGPDPVPDPGSGSGGLTLGTTMMAGGGALVLGGVITNFALVNPTWAAVADANADPTTIDRADAEALTGRFNTFRGLTLGLLGGGVALTGVGVLLEAPVLPVLGPGHLGFTGRF